MANDENFRVIVHVDLDCFYAQVEMLRLGIPEDVPYVLLQWSLPVAVNYPAREFGIKRFESFKEARTKCPQLQYSSSPTYAPGDVHWAYHANPDRQTHKMSLEPYRIAGQQVFDCIQSFEGVVLEKGGIDEAFLDVTEAASSRLQQQQPSSDCYDLTDEDHIKAVLGYTASATKLIERRPEVLAEYGDAVPPSPPKCSEWQLALLGHACVVVKEIRGEVKRKLGYNISAGVALNKQLAKLVSAAHKPNHQTCCPIEYSTTCATSPSQSFEGSATVLGKSFQRASMLSPVETCGGCLSTLCDKPCPRSNVKNQQRLSNPKASHVTMQRERMRQQPKQESLWRRQQKFSFDN